MNLFRKLCITLGSISKEGPYDPEFLSNIKAHTVVEDERCILVIVLVADVRFSMSDINNGLQPF